jgi:hypothetical protein
VQDVAKQFVRQPMAAVSSVAMPDAGHGTFVALGHYAHMMYRVALTVIRAVLMTAAVVSVGVAAFLVASVALEWL